MDILLGLMMFVVSNAEVLTGVVMLFLIDFLNKDVHTERGRFFIAALACFGAALLLNFNEILYGSPEQVFATTTLIFTESQAVFKFYFKDSWVRWFAQGFYKPEQKNGSETIVGASANPESEIIPIVE